MTKPAERLHCEPCACAYQRRKNHHEKRRKDKLEAKNERTNERCRQRAYKMKKRKKKKTDKNAHQSRPSDDLSFVEWELKQYCYQTQTSVCTRLWFFVRTAYRMHSAHRCICSSHQFLWHHMQTARTHSPALVPTIEWLETDRRPGHFPNRRRRRQSPLYMCERVLECTRKTTSSFDRQTFWWVSECAFFFSLPIYVFKGRIHRLYASLSLHFLPAIPPNRCATVWSNSVRSWRREKKTRNAKFAKCKEWNARCTKRNL